MAPFQDEEEGRETPNRRRELRWNIPIPVRVKGRRTDGTEFDEETITTDASPSGMCILLTVALEKGDRLSVTAPEEKFESSATVDQVSALGLNMNRVRVFFPKRVQFGRSAAEKKYVYDYGAENWVGYMTEGIYYNTKHEPFGNIEDQQILSLTSGKVLFKLSTDRVFDLRMNCIGHII